MSDVMSDCQVLGACCGICNVLDSQWSLGQPEPGVRLACYCSLQGRKEQAAGAPTAAGVGCASLRVGTPGGDHALRQRTWQGVSNA